MSYNVCYDYNKCFWNLQTGQLVYFCGARWLVVGLVRSYVMLSNRETHEIVSLSIADNINERVRLCDDAFWDDFTDIVFSKDDEVALVDSLPLDDLRYYVQRVDQRRCRVCLRVVRSSDNVFVSNLWVGYDDIMGLSFSFEKRSKKNEK